MFDWDDEELTNIIWDASEGRGDDHIVPFPEASEAYGKNKEWTHEASNIKLEEQKAPPAARGDINGRKSDSTSKVDNSEGTSSTGFHMDPWPDISLAKVAITDQDCLETSVSSLSEITIFDSPGGGAETANPPKDLETFQIGDQSKEQADFVDYGWANIGSFDDLDRIFSNDDSIFGNVNLGNADELWSSSKEVASTSEKSYPQSIGSPSLKLGGQGNLADPYGVKAEHTQEEDRTPTLQNAHAISSVEYEQTDLNPQPKNSPVKLQITAENATMPSDFTNKACKQKKRSKGRRKMVERNDMMSYPAAYHYWNTSGSLSGKFKNQAPPPTMLSSASSDGRQQMQPGAAESLHYHQVSSPFVAPFGYGNVNLTNPCSSMPMLGHVQSAEFKNQSLPSNQTSVNRFTSTAAKAKSMTPREKIKKLRRRQQMRAMLAIQKQQQQFGHQVPSNDHPVNKRAWEETQVQHSSEADAGVEDPSALISFEMGSPLEQDYSSAVSPPVKECRMEESVLSQLQDIIAKLDVGVRLCIRDSLFRLAESAMQRNSACNPSNEKLATVDAASSSDRNPMIPEEETKTNQIDRIVAHLLFHRPQEQPGNHPRMPESPASTRHKTSFPSEAPGDQHDFPSSGSRISCLSSDPMPIGQTRNVLLSETSENASNCGMEDEAARQPEASI